jgi:hypothetical protein
LERHGILIFPKLFRVQNLLGKAANKRGWTFVPALSTSSRGRRIVPDGTVRDEFLLPRIWWEDQFQLKVETGSASALVTGRIELGITGYEPTSRSVSGEHFPTSRRVYNVHITEVSH